MSSTGARRRDTLERRSPIARSPSDSARAGATFPIRRAALRSWSPESSRRASGVALVFGNETSGLSNEELALCQRFASIPANPEYSVAQPRGRGADRLLRARRGRGRAPLPRGDGTAATGDDLAGLFEHLEASTLASGYSIPRRPGRFMERMRRLFARTGLEREEVKLIRGMLGRFENRMKGRTAIAQSVLTARWRRKIRPTAHPEERQ
jgi:tRNA/rRNA methyltransferase